MSSPAHTGGRHRKGRRLESIEPPRHLVDQVYEVILDALCNGTFKPGERLTQEDIAARLNVSRQPVTHALTLLKAQGFLTQTGKRGLTVTTVDADFFKAIYEFRSVVDALAVKLATPRLTKQAIQEARDLVDNGRKAATSNNSRASLQADMDFHQFIYANSGNPIIEETMRLHWRHLYRGMGQILRHPGMSVAVWKEHAEILERMIEGDGDGAAEIMRRHLSDAYERVRP